MSASREVELLGRFVGTATVTPEGLAFTGRAEFGFRCPGCGAARRLLLAAVGAIRLELVDEDPPFRFHLCPDCGRMFGRRERRQGDTFVMECYG